MMSLGDFHLGELKLFVAQSNVGKSILVDTPFLTEEKLITEIDRMVKGKGVNHIDAVLAFCENNRVDIEDIKPLIGSALKERIRVDAMDTGLMRKEPKLEF